MRFAFPISVTLAALCLPLIVAAQSKRAGDLRVGKLLVAARDFPDPTFARSVVLLVQFDEDGTVGLIVNHRTKIPISRALEQLKAANNRTDPIYLGGPVNLAAVMALLRASSKPDEAKRVLGDVYLVSARPLLEKTLAAGTGPAEFHVFVGYCGWAAGQLEGEMNMGAWYLFDADAKLVFDSDPESLWSRLIARTEQIFVRTAPPGMALRKLPWTN